MELISPSPTAPVAEPTPYAGFWLRAAAIIIDGIILGIIKSILLSPFLAMLGITAAMHAKDINNMSPDQQMGWLAAFMATAMITMPIMAAIGWLYYALMESSKNQGTLGKMAVGIKVTDMDGNRISFARATGRYFAKILSGFILGIGYLIAAFTAKKQALHDIIAETLVVKR